MSSLNDYQEKISMMLSMITSMGMRGNMAEDTILVGEETTMTEDMKMTIMMI